MLEIWNHSTMDHYNLSVDVIPWMQPCEPEIAQSNHATEQDSTVTCIDSRYSKTNTCFAVILHILQSLGAKLPGLKRLVLQDHTALWYTFKTGSYRHWCVGQELHNSTEQGWLSEPGQSAEQRLTLLLHRMSFRAREDVNPAPSSSMHLQYQSLKIQLFALHHITKVVTWSKACDIQMWQWQEPSNWKKSVTACRAATE